MNLIDGHIHLVDFLQQSDGIDVLLRQMDAGGIDRAVVFGMPVVKKWNAYDPREPKYYLDDNARCYYYSFTDQLVVDALQSLTDTQRSRFAPMACGFNPTDMHGIRHLERIWQSYPHWAGVGEVLLRHDDLTNLMLEESARANHPAMMPIYEFCTARDLPILLHTNSSSVGCHNEYVYLHELEEALAIHPKLKVVWAHAGLSRRVTHDAYFEMIERMLVSYPRLHIDLSWIGYDEVICRDGIIQNEWLALIERRAERFLIGSDLVGHFDKLPATMGRYAGLLDRLSPAAREAVAWKTTMGVYFGK